MPSLKHNFVSAIPDDPASVLAGEVVPTNWNAEHDLLQATNTLLGRSSPGTGPTEEITVGAGLSLSGGSISIPAGAYLPLTLTGDTTVALGSFELQFTSDDTKPLTIGRAVPNVAPFTDFPGALVASEAAGGGTVSLVQASTDGSALPLRYYKSRGTLAAPTPVINTDTLGGQVFFGYAGGQYNFAGLIAAEVSGAVSGTTVPTDLIFYNRLFSQTLRLTDDGDVIASGQVAVGTSINSQIGVRFGLPVVGAAQTFSVVYDGQIQPGVTSAFIFSSSPSTQATAFTLTHLRHFYAAPTAVFGAGSTVTNQYGFACDAFLTGATNNYGFHGNITAGANNYNLYMLSDAKNFLGGPLQVAGPTVTTSNPVTTVSQTWNAGAVAFIGAVNTYTSTASAAGSLLEVWRLGASDIFSIGKAAILVPQGTTTVPGIGFQGGIAHYGFSYNGGAVHLIANNTGVVAVLPTGISGNGISSISAFKMGVDPRTANATLTATLYGIVETNEGTAVKPVLTLPTAERGGQHWFAIEDADGIRVQAAAGDTIRVIDKVTAAAGYVESVTIGSTLYLVALNATEWFAMVIHGIWTDGTFTYDDTSLTTP